MRIQPQPLTCAKCGHEWCGELVVDAPVAVFSASMKAFHCPSCGVGLKHVLLGQKRPAEPAQAELPVAAHG